jgi:hypothetical protein
MQSSPQSENRLARARLTFTAEPADPVMGALVRLAEPAGVLSWIDAGMIPARVAGHLQRTDRTLGGALSRWRNNLRSAPDAAALPHTSVTGSACSAPARPDGQEN